MSFLLLTDFCFCRQMLKPSCLPGVEGIGRRVRIAVGATSLDASVLVPPRFSRLILGHGWGYLNKVWSVLIFRTLSHCVGRRPPRRRKRRVFARLNAGADAFLNFEFIETQTPCAPEAEGCERASISENFYRGSPMKSSFSLSLSLSLSLSSF